MSVQNPIADLHSAPVDGHGAPTAELGPSIRGEKDLKDEKALYGNADEDVQVTAAPYHVDDSLVPTEEDLLTLRKVPAPMNFAAWAMCLIEFSERASYYGSIGPFNNFINNPLPEGGNGAGAVAPGEAGLNQSAGALGKGSVAASALVNMFTFLAYVIPFWGAISADTQVGRFKAIAIGTAVGALAHVMLVIPAIPQVIAVPNASLATFVISIVTLAGAAGYIKPSLGPLLCDQIPVKQPTLSVTKKGERVIIDPGVTVERWLLIFYWSINIGAFTAIATSYASRFVGFWLAFFLPGILYMLMPIVLVIISKRLYKAPPQGSVVLECFKVFKHLLGNGGLSRMWKGGDDFWNRAKPSWIAAQNNGHLDITKVFWDDKFVDEIKQSLHACAVFFIIPIFNLGNGGIGNSLNSMSTAMTLNGAPNDLISNFNALSIVIATPILNYGLYPFMARIGWPLRPMTRLCIGFLLASVSNVAAALIQWRVYETSPCGYSATSACDDVSPVSLWYQILIVSPPAIGELFVNVTAYELAYTRSPARMKGFVYSFTLFNQAISAAIMLALASVIRDPWLMWPWTAMACTTFCVAWVFPIYFKHLNIPMKDFADRDRQAGLHQPKVIGEEKAAAGGVSH